MTEPTSPSPGAGALIRAAREKQGLHIAALAAAIKVSPRKLDALENDRWQELPDATFTRALAQTVCRTLKVDPRPILDKLPAAASLPLDASDAGLNEPFRDRPGREDPAFGAAAVRPMVWGAAVLMLAAVLVYLLPVDLWNRMAPAPAPTAAPAAPAPAAAVAGTAPAEAAAVELAASASVALTELTPAASASAALPAPAPAPAPTPPTPTVASVAAVPAAAVGPLQLKTTAASWIEARDARGSILFSRTVVAGEAVALDGRLPIRLTIGNASATRVEFRGRSVDLAASSRDNVARLELQ